MGTAAGIFTHQMTAGQALTRNTATPMASATTGTSSTSGSGDSSDSSATISANDFLTLLVTEMQNQDPTSDTDPNEYINQLVQVNSLEQLIDINQTLSTDAGSTSGTGASPQAVGAASNPTNAATPASAAASPHTAAHLAGSPLSTTPGATAANASASQAITNAAHFGEFERSQRQPCSARVGHALAGRTHAAPVQGTSPATQ